MRLVNNQRVLGGDQSEGYVKGPHATALVKSLGKALFRHHPTKSGARRRRHPDFVPQYSCNFIKEKRFFAHFGMGRALKRRDKFFGSVTFFFEIANSLDSQIFRSLKLQV